MNDLEEFVNTTREILDRITPETDINWTGYRNVEDLQASINQDLNELENGNLKYLLPIYKHFLPTSTFQEIRIDDNWDQEYLDIANRMDELYRRLKPIERQKTNFQKISEWTKSILNFKL